jgi:hypothetical protein
VNNKLEVKLTIPLHVGGVERDVARFFGNPTGEIHCDLMPGAADDPARRLTFRTLSNVKSVVSFDYSAEGTTTMKIVANFGHFITRVPEEEKEETTAEQES